MILQDSSNVLWSVTVDDTGLLRTTALGSGTAPAITLNDPSNTTTWTLGVSTFGLLTTTSAGFTANPLSLLLVSTSGKTDWFLRVSSFGDLETILAGFGVVAGGQGFFVGKMQVRPVSEFIA